MLTSTTSLMFKFPLDLPTTTPSLSNNSNKRELIIFGATKGGVNQKADKLYIEIRKIVVISLHPMRIKYPRTLGPPHWSVLG